jgi:hypothetical protein
LWKGVEPYVSLELEQARARSQIDPRRDDGPIGGAGQELLTSTIVVSIVALA